MPEPARTNISGPVLLMWLGIIFFLPMAATALFLPHLYGMPSWIVVLGSVALAWFSAAVLGVVQKRPAPYLLIPLMACGWAVVITLVLFLMAGEFNRYGERGGPPGTHAR